MEKECLKSLAPLTLTLEGHIVMVLSQLIWAQMGHQYGQPPRPGVLRYQSTC